jgi:hypothetical protein
MQNSGRSSVSCNFSSEVENYNNALQNQLEEIISQLQLLRVEQEDIICQQREVIEAKQKAIEYWQRAIEIKEEANRVNEKSVWEFRNQVKDLVDSQIGSQLFVWKLTEIPTWKDYEQQESPEFNSAPDINGHRYRLRATLYPQGAGKTDEGEPTHAAIGWRIIAGKDDEFLEWPAHLHLVVRVPLPGPPTGELRTFGIVRSAEPQHPAYSKPKSATEKRESLVVPQWITLQSVEACLTRDGEMHVAISARPCNPIWRK